MGQDWEPGDAKWLKERKAEWRYIKGNLKRGQTSPERIADYERYFLTGFQVIDELDNSGLDGLWRCWMTKDRDEPHWRQILRGDPALQGYRQRFLREGLTWEFTAPYGYMGGLELRLAKLLFPSDDPDGTFELEGTSVPMLPRRPKDYFLDDWLFSGARWLAQPTANPFWIGPVLRNLAWRCAEKPLRSEGFVSLAQQLLQVRPEDSPRRRFAQALRQDLETRPDIPEWMRTIWSDAKAKSKLTLAQIAEHEAAGTMPASAARAPTPEVEPPRDVDEVDLPLAEIRARLPQDEMRRKALELLTAGGESRPTFAEDVERKYRKIFEAFDQVGARVAAKLVGEDGIRVVLDRDDLGDAEMVGFGLIAAGGKDVVALTESSDGWNFYSINRSGLKPLAHEETHEALGEELRDLTPARKLDRLVALHQSKELARLARVPRRPRDDD